MHYLIPDRGFLVIMSQLIWFRMRGGWDHLVNRRICARHDLCAGHSWSSTRTQTGLHGFCAGHLHGFCAVSQISVFVLIRSFLGTHTLSKTTSACTIAPGRLNRLLTNIRYNQLLW